MRAKPRTRNLIHDVIGQSGAVITRFIVEGEKHNWVHVAIDRFTGQVVDKQIKVVNE